TEQDLNELVARHLPPDQPVEDVRLRVAPEGVYVSGVYPLFVNVAFETLWELGVRGGRATARLAGFKALGLPAMVFKSMVMKVIEDAAQTEDWLQVEDSTVLADVERLLRNRVPVRANLTAVRCDAGRLVIESAAAPGQGVADPVQ